MYIHTHHLSFLLVQHTGARGLTCTIIQLSHLFIPSNTIEPTPLLDYPVLLYLFCPLGEGFVEGLAG